MKKFISVLSLILAVAAITCFMHACSDTLSVETPKTETRTDPDSTTEIWLPFLEVNYVDRSLIQLRWFHSENMKYDYVYIYRTRTGANLEEPMVIIPMGVDPFAYDLRFLTPEHAMWVGYEEWNYQVMGVSLREEESVTGNLIIHWQTQVVRSSEPAYRYR